MVADVRQTTLKKDSSLYIVLPTASWEHDSNQSAPFSRLLNFST